MSRVVQYDSDGNEYYPFQDWDKEPVECRECEYNHDFYKCSKCDCFIPKIGCVDGKKKQSKTNADRIRAMTDEELARFIWQPDALMIYVRKKLNTPPHIRYSEEQVLDWLKQEATE